MSIDQYILFNLPFDHLVPILTTRYEINTDNIPESFKIAKNDIATEKLFIETNKCHFHLCLDMLLRTEYDLAQYNSINIIELTPTKTIIYVKLNNSHRASGDLYITYNLDLYEKIFYTKKMWIYKVMDFIKETIPLHFYYKRHNEVRILDCALVRKDKYNNITNSIISFVTVANCFYYAFINYAANNSLNKILSSPFLSMNIMFVQSLWYISLGFTISNYCPYYSNTIFNSIVGLSNFRNTVKVIDVFFS